MKNLHVTFIGGGNMAGAILEGCLAKGWYPTNCHVIEISSDRREFLKKQYGIKTHETMTQANTAIRQSHVVILAVKPQQMQEVAEILKDCIHEGESKPLIISIAAGIRLKSLSQWLGGYTHIIRAMPNMAAFIHKSITALVALPDITSSQKNTATQLIQSIGDVLWLDDETQLDAVTAVSGSGPAYVFYFIEALQTAAEQLGLTSDHARQLALKTFEGASRLAFSSDDTPTQLREKVTSKGGTTEAALKHLDATDAKNHFIDAVKAAAERSRVLGK